MEVKTARYVWRELGDGGPARIPDYGHCSEIYDAVFFADGYECVENFTIPQRLRFRGYQQPTITNGTTMRHHLLEQAMVMTYG